MTNVKIKEIAIYHPEHEVDNDFYISHFKEKGRDSSKFISEILGRNKRFIIDNDQENSLTMAITASKRVLEKANMIGKDLDMIVFSSQTPEYTATSNAIHVHQAIEAGSHTMVEDSNANCAGMTLAIDKTSRYMLHNPHIKTALVVGSDYKSLMSNPDEEITYANFGDASCAVVLEKTEEDTGFIDSIYHVNTITYDKTYFPRHGLSNLIRKPGEEQSIQWLPFDGDLAIPPTYEMFETLVNRNGMAIQDIDIFCLSQFSVSNIRTIQEHYELEDDKVMYSGDRFGYTGTSSPLMALYNGIESGKVKRGDTVLFWTIGGGFQLVAMLFKY